MDVRELYDRKADAYVRFASSFRHQAGIEALLEHSGRLRAGLRVLDAGCGTGFATLALIEALRRRGLSAGRIEAFDLTAAMLARFRQTLESRNLSGVELRQADVRRLDLLPDSWTGYDLVISVSMLEYVPRAELSPVLQTLRQRLASGGTLVVVITRKNFMTWWLIEKGWKANRYSRRELNEAFATAGFGRVSFRRYPFPFFWLGLSNHVVVADA